MNLDPKKKYLSHEGIDFYHRYKEIIESNREVILKKD